MKNSCDLLFAKLFQLHCLLWTFDVQRGMPSRWENALFSLAAATADSTMETVGVGKGGAGQR